MLRKHFAACGFSLNPLHCGAVVASYCRFNSLSKPLICLNPLHCGAVVASWGPRAGEGRAAMSQSPSLRGSGRFRGRILDRKWCYHVSIPFIAGQWSLPGRATATPEPPTSLNPLHCGAVVASLVSLQRCKDMTLSLNPLHCGAVVASPWYRVPLSPPPRVSIPFIAGQWSLHHAPHRDRLAQLVSIPFIAGQWSLPRPPPRSPPTRGSVSIPFIAGQWSLLFQRVVALLRIVKVSIPFIAGQWSLLSARSPQGGGQRRSLNPLHCGAVVASCLPKAGGVSEKNVSIPFIAGQWSLQERLPRERDLVRRSQSPSLRGSGRFSRT